MTPSRPEFRSQRESSISDGLLPTQTETWSNVSDTQAALASSQVLGVPRNDSSASALAGLRLEGTIESDQVVSSVEPTPTSPATEISTARQQEPLQALVVDDDALTRMLMTRLLTRLGCVVTTGENGAKALEILLGPVFTPSETTTPSTAMPSTPGTPGSGIENSAPVQPRVFDIIFLDNQMPLVSGLEAIARLRAAGRQDFVVGVTGNALIRDQDEYLTAGVDHVLIKPVLEKSLKQMLTLAERRRAATAEGGTPSTF